jgi:hypothetical protein
MSAPSLFAAASTKKLVMLAGKPSHGPMEHEFNAGVLLLRKCLTGFPGLEVAHYHNGWPDSEKGGPQCSHLDLQGGGTQRRRNLDRE